MSVLVSVADTVPTMVPATPEAAPQVERAVGSDEDITIRITLYRRREVMASAELALRRALRPAGELLTAVLRQA